MSAVALAPARARKGRSARTAEMTPEQELQFLIEEQQRDDTYFIRKPLGEISLEGPAPGLDGHVEDFIGMTDGGEIVNFLLRSEESLFLINITHSTFNAYNNLKCRCQKCKTFMSDYRRQKRAES